MNNAVILLGIAVVAVLVGVFAFSPGDDTPVVAPEFSLESLDGDIVSLSSYRGRVVVIDFWATWCKPCLTSFPRLHHLVEQVGEEDVAMLVVSLDKSASRARTYLEENGYATSNVLWESLEASRGAKELFDVVGIPHTFVIDREGLIQYSGHPNRLSREELEGWL